MEPQSTLEQVFEAERKLRHARLALTEVMALPMATEIMRDAAYQTVANLIDKIATLDARWEAEVAAWQAELSAAA